MTEVNRPSVPANPGSDELLRMIGESATDFAIFTTDPRGVVTTWNVGAERMLGYTESEMVGQSADVIFPPEEGGSAAAEEERRVALAHGRAEDERWQVRKDGSRFWASGLLMPLAERSLGFLKILRDRTEQHRAEARVRESEERFRLLATSIPQLVFQSRNDGWRTWGSPQWIDFTGLGLGKSIGLGWLDAIHPDDRAATQSAWRHAVEQGVDYYVEHRVRRNADGEYRWHQTRARPIADPNGEWVGTMTDVHELRGLQSRQQLLMAELLHRTRNLLAVIQAIANQTRRVSGSLEAFGIEFDSRLRALSRVQGLLERPDQQEVDLRALVVAEMEAHLDRASSDGRLRIDGPSVLLPAEAAQVFGLALHELATNAVKYGALSQPRGALAIVWQVQRDGSGPRLLLDWLETGVPMPHAAELARKGFGTELIKRALPYQLGARTELAFGSDGVRCTVAIPLDAHEAEAA